MDTDLRRQLVTLLTYGVTVVVNTAAVVVPLGGFTTAELSDRFPVLVTPANYVFSIWSVIYLLLLGFTAYQALPAQRADPALRRLGYLPAITGVLNASWVLLWQYQVFALTVPVMLALLLTLIACHMRLREPVASGRPAAFGWLVVLPFSVYLGWITVATIANISQMLYHAGYRGAPIGEDAWAAIVLIVGLTLGVAMLMRHRDVAFAAVIVWAYLGIAVKQWDATAAAWIAVACAILVVALVVLVVAGRLPPRDGLQARGTP